MVSREHSQSHRKKSKLIGHWGNRKNGGLHTHEPKKLDGEMRNVFQIKLHDFLGVDMNHLDDVDQKNKV